MHLNPTLARIQPGIQHSGRRPQPTIEEKRAQLTQFKTQLKAAVESEDFESAAGLRDQIARLESQFSATQL
jgi:protein arginine kinase activator